MDRDINKDALPLINFFAQTYLGAEPAVYYRIREKVVTEDAVFEIVPPKLIEDKGNGQRI